MSYTHEKKNDTEVVFTFTISWEETQKTFQKLLESAAKNVDVKGFRPGKVPKDVAQSRVDRAGILSQAASELISEHYGQAITKEELRVIAQPEVHVTKLAEGNPLECTVTCAVMPEITLSEKWRDDISALNKKKSQQKEDTNDDDVDKELERLAQSRAQSKAVARAAKDGDQVILDFTVLRDHVPIENGSGKDHTMILGKKTFIPGFEEHVVGMKKGQEKKFTLAFPKEYHAKDLAGQEAEFHVTLKDVQERTVAKIDDAFAQSAGKFDNLDALKKNIKEGIAQEKNARQKEERRSAYLDALSAYIDVTLPQAVIDAETDKMLSELRSQIAMSGMDLDAYFEKMNKTITDVRSEWRDQAIKRVKSAMVLEHLIKELDVSADKEKIEAEMNKTLEYYKSMGQAQENVNTTALYEYTKAQLQNDTVFDLLEKLQ